MLRILLDAKDLIDIVEHGRPITVDQFRAWLIDKKAAVVLSFTNINDFVGKAFEQNAFLEMRPLLQSIETLPHTYMQEGMIKINELREALVGYRAGREPSPINPYVRRWDETAFWENASAANILV